MERHELLKSVINAEPYTQKALNTTVDSKNVVLVGRLS